MTFSRSKIKLSQGHKAGDLYLYTQPETGERQIAESRCNLSIGPTHPPATDRCCTYQPLHTAGVRGAEMSIVLRKGPGGCWPGRKLCSLYICAVYKYPNPFQFRIQASRVKCPATTSADKLTLLPPFHTQRAEPGLGCSVHTLGPGISLRLQSRKARRG